MDYINSIGLGPEKTKYLTRLAEKVKSLLRPPLFRHSMNTLRSSIEIADTCGQKVDIYRLSAASLVHDYGKVFATGELKKIALEEKLGISKFGLGMEPILHSLVERCIHLRGILVQLRHLLDCLGVRK